MRQLLAHELCSRGRSGCPCLKCTPTGEGAGIHPIMYILVLELLSHKQLSQSFLIPVTCNSRLPWTVIIVYPSFLVGQCCTEGAKGSHRSQKFVPNVSGQSFSPRKSSMQLLWSLSNWREPVTADETLGGWPDVQPGVPDVLLSHLNSYAYMKDERCQRKTNWCATGSKDVICGKPFHENLSEIMRWSFIVGPYEINLRFFELMAWAILNLNWALNCLLGLLHCPDSNNPKSVVDSQCSSPTGGRTESWRNFGVKFHIRSKASLNWTTMIICIYIYIIIYLWPFAKNSWQKFCSCW